MHGGWSSSLEQLCLLCTFPRLCLLSPTLLLCSPGCFGLLFAANSTLPSSSSRGSRSQMQVLHNQSALLESWPGMTGSLSAPLSCTHRFLNCRIQFSIWQEKGGSQTSQMKRQISSPLKGNSQTPPMQRAKTLFHIFGTGSSVRMIHWSRHHSGSS